MKNNRTISHWATPHLKHTVLSLPFYLTFSFSSSHCLLLYIFFKSLISSQIPFVQNENLYFTDPSFSFSQNTFLLLMETILLLPFAPLFLTPWHFSKLQKSSNSQWAHYNPSEIDGSSLQCNCEGFQNSNDSPRGDRWSRLTEN